MRRATPASTTRFSSCPRRSAGRSRAVFDFCRAVDDSVDLETDAGARRAAVATLARRGRPRVRRRRAGDAAGAGAAAVRRACRLPREQFDALVDGVAMDAAPRRYATFADLEPVLPSRRVVGRPHLRGDLRVPPTAAARLRARSRRGAPADEHPARRRRGLSDAAAATCPPRTSSAFGCAEADIQRRGRARRARRPIAAGARAARAPGGARARVLFAGRPRPAERRRAALRRRRDHARHLSGSAAAHRSRRLRRVHGSVRPRAASGPGAARAADVVARWRDRRRDRRRRRHRRGIRRAQRRRASGRRRAARRRRRRGAAAGRTRDGLHGPRNAASASTTASTSCSAATARPTHSCERVGTDRPRAARIAGSLSRWPATTAGFTCCPARRCRRPGICSRACCAGRAVPMRDRLAARLRARARSADVAPRPRLWSGRRSSEWLARARPAAAPVRVAVESAGDRRAQSVAGYRRRGARSCACWPSCSVPRAATRRIGVPAVPLDELYALPAARFIESRGGVGPDQIARRASSSIAAAPRAASAPGKPTSPRPWSSAPCRGTPSVASGRPGAPAARRARRRGRPHGSRSRSSPSTSGSTAPSCPSRFVGLVDGPMHWAFDKSAR